MFPENLSLINLNSVSGNNSKVMGSIQEVQSSFVCHLYRYGDQTYFDEIKQFYYRDEFSHQVQEWNKQRTLAIERSLQQFLYPQMAKELKNKLIAEAKDNIVKVQC